MKISIYQVQSAFERLRMAMRWTCISPFSNGKSNVGATYLEQGPMATFAVYRVFNDRGGVTSILGSWRGKRAAYFGLISAAQAVERFKDENNV